MRQGLCYLSDNVDIYFMFSYICFHSLLIVVDTESFPLIISLCLYKAGLRSSKGTIINGCHLPHCHCILLAQLNTLHKRRDYIETTLSATFSVNEYQPAGYCLGSPSQFGVLASADIFTSCGAPVKVTLDSTGQSVEVKIIDQCAGREMNHLDLFADAFA
jgi:hypothetical protein